MKIKEVLLEQSTVISKIDSICASIISVINDFNDVVDAKGSEVAIKNTQEFLESVERDENVWLWWTQFYKNDIKVTKSITRYNNLKDRLRELISTGI